MIKYSEHFSAYEFHFVKPEKTLLFMLEGKNSKSAGQ